LTQRKEENSLLAEFHAKRNSEVKNMEDKMNSEYKIQLRELIERFERNKLDTQERTDKKVSEK